MFNYVIPSDKTITRRVEESPSNLKKHVTEDLLSVESIRYTCAGDKCNSVNGNECNSSLTKASLSYEKIKDVTTKGAPAMIGNQKGFQERCINE